jgi:hypothetical protein
MRVFRDRTSRCVLVIFAAAAVTGCGISVSAHLGTSEPTLNTANLERVLVAAVRQQTGL